MKRNNKGKFIKSNAPKKERIRVTENEKQIIDVMRKFGVLKDLNDEFLTMENYHRLPKKEQIIIESKLSSKVWLIYRGNLILMDSKPIKLIELTTILKGVK